MSKLFFERRSPSGPDVGREWLYRESVRKPWRRVELLEAAGDNPKRVRIQHVDASEGGRAEWVPSSRLYVPWELSNEYLAGVAAQESMAAHSPGNNTSYLAERVISTYIPSRVADMDFTGGMGALRVHDLAALADLTKIATTELTSGDDSLHADDAWYLVWPTLERVLTTLVRRDPGPAMVLLDELTNQRHSFNRLVEVEGERWWMRDDADESWSRKMRRLHDVDAQHIRQLRAWLDQEHPTLARSYLEMRGLYAEMAAALREAIPRVRMGRSQTADRIADRMQELLERPTPFLDVRGVTSEPDRTDVL